MITRKHWIKSKTVYSVPWNNTQKQRPEDGLNQQTNSGCGSNQSPERLRSYTGKHILYGRNVNLQRETKTIHQTVAEQVVKGLIEGDECNWQETERRQQVKQTGIREGTK